MFNRPKTVPHFTHSLVLCKNRLLTHCAIVSLQIIFFKISQQIARIIYQGTVDLSANDDLEIKTEPPN